MPLARYGDSSLYYSSLPSTLRTLDISRVTLDRQSAPFLVRFLERAESLGDIGFHISERDRKSSDKILNDVLGALSKLPLERLRRMYWGSGLQKSP
jgi:hypothetical protein